jgi:DnaJ family protein A protein 2
MFGGIPFEQFAGGGGRSSNSRGSSSNNSNSAVDTTKLYETLEVDKKATSKEIKKSYFRLSKVHHPDRGGDEHKFKEINAAYEILSDEETRKAYDQYGLEGVNDNGATAARGGEDLFSMFFGGGRGGGRGQPQGPRKGPSINHPLSVSLADLYNGKTVKMAINRKVIVGQATTCDTCKGQGAVLEMRQIGPGMITQVQRTCHDCAGQGTTAETKQERTVVEVHVEKGMNHNSKIAFRGMGDEMPNREVPGDVNFIIQEKEHELFKRKGADLLIVKEISLNQALTGFSVSWEQPIFDEYM